MDHSHPMRAHLRYLAYLWRYSKLDRYKIGIAATATILQVSFFEREREVLRALWSSPSACVGSSVHSQVYRVILAVVEHEIEYNIEL